jgi:hypothetical protein
MFCIEITEGALIYNMVHYVDFVRNVIIEINNVNFFDSFFCVES